MRELMGDDFRIRNLVQYGGAMRTLRWAGRGPQIQNYPRPATRIDVKWALADILRGVDADTVRLVHGLPMDVVSQCLRSAYVPARAALCRPRHADAGLRRRQRGRALTHARLSGGRRYHPLKGMAVTTSAIGRSAIAMLWTGRRRT
jgi:hypothetical protein